MSTPTYCSLLAAAAREPLAGTASHGRGCIVVAYPKRLWGPNVLSAEGLPVALVDALVDAQERFDVVTRFVAGDSAERTEITFYPAAVRFSDVPIEAAADVVTGYVSGSLTRGELVTRPMLLTCTHGQRDRCCARFGLALMDAMRACENVGAIDVREASHLGGDRFAPTVMILPSGHVYGHLTPEDAPLLIEAARGGAPLLARFRGSFWRDVRAQLADVAAFGLSREGEAPPTLSSIDVTELDDTHSELSFRASWADRSQAVRVRCVREHRRVYGDCRAADAKRTGGLDAWRIENVST
ncbi:MAG: sucrase ferredoxin [Deltaproteobacteria bacterium]|nr:sucrase ferredoxin [Deltaproteobacteria bacterium]